MDGLVEVMRANAAPPKASEISIKRKGVLGVSIVMIKPIYHVYSERGYFHKRPKLGDRTSPSSGLVRLKRANFFLFPFTTKEKFPTVASHLRHFEAS